MANKLSNKHIDFKKLIMKVNLAAQLLSKSVGLALQTLVDNRCPEFEGAEATIEFINNINNLFDVMRHPHGKSFKKAINIDNIAKVEEELMAIKLYLLTLKNVDGKYLYLTNRHTCITGFVTNIHSIVAVARIVLVEQKYFLTYKLSQDHLELFFNAVRRSGGWNNNPSTPQFMFVMKSYLVGLSAGNNGNVENTDATTFVLPNSYVFRRNVDCCSTLTSSFIEKFENVIV